MKKLAVLFLLIWVTPTLAGDIDFQPAYTQQMFKDFSKEVGAAVIYRGLAPGHPLGLTGFDIGVEGTFTKISSDQDSWKKAVKGNDPPTYLSGARVHAQKGLPFGFDVGVAVGKIADTDISYAGGEVRYSILKGGILEPNIAVRGSYSQTFGVDQLDLKTYGLDISASKGFGVGIKIIPYVGIGQYWMNSKPQNLTAGVNLDKENFSSTRVFGGARLQMALFTVTAEVDYIEVPSLSLRAGITW
jgi:hypothetical protein